MIASTIKIIRIIFSIIHQVISTVVSTYNHQISIKSFALHLSDDQIHHQALHHRTKSYNPVSRSIIPSFIHQSDALSSQKFLIHFEISASIIHFSLSVSVIQFFVYIISLLLSFFFLLLFFFHIISSHQFSDIARFCFFVFFLFCLLFVLSFVFCVLFVVYWNNFRFYQRLISYFFSNFFFANFFTNFFVDRTID